MATKQLVTKVWIAPGCIVCDACETTAPEVFHVQEQTCVIRPEALTPDFTKPRSELIVEAAQECPVDVIKFETIEVDAAEAPAPAPAAAPAAAPVMAMAADVPAAAPKAVSAVAAAAAAPAVSTDPAIAAMLKATTARGGKSGHLGGDAAPAVKALRSRKIDELPPDARYPKVLEAAKETLSEPKVTRRATVGAAAVGWAAFAGANALGGLALQRFMFPNVLEEPDPKVRIGEVSKFAEMAVGQVNEEYKSKGIWIVRLEGEIAALSTTCTHLGCIPNWLEAERKFKCPCHGSGFMQSGINFEGPAPRPLERFQISVEDGVVVVNRAKKFQQEKGEWTNPDSFISV
ncbi:MAG: Rieske 2Fe-2S domain-containing protein [Phycisphaerae bacterium]|jgi:cytochrome b6-f complex iron-sulfur subunit